MASHLVHVSKTPHNENVRTPPRLLQVISAEFGAFHDPCPFMGADAEGGIDGLTAPWEAVNFVNPPYNDVERWLQKGLDECRLGRTSIFLIPCRPHTIYWLKFIHHCADLRFIKKTMKFGGYTRTYREPMVLWVYDGKNVEPGVTGAPQKITWGWNYRLFDTPQDDDNTGTEMPVKVVKPRAPKPLPSSSSPRKSVKAAAASSKRPRGRPRKDAQQARRAQAAAEKE
jgi:hypothetical protein